MLFFVSALLLPTNVLAFKVFNYDKLSMLLGVIALLYIAIAWRQSRSTPAAVGIVTSCLAAQEKLVASPIVLIAIVSVCMPIRRSGKCIAKTAAAWSTARVCSLSCYRDCIGWRALCHTVR